MNRILQHLDLNMFNLMESPKKNLRDDVGTGDEVVFMGPTKKINVFVKFIDLIFFPIQLR